MTGMVFRSISFVWFVTRCNEANYFVNKSGLRPISNDMCGRGGPYVGKQGR